MTGTATVIPLVGHSPIGNWWAPDNVQRHPLGTVVSFVDQFWGGGELIYLQAPLSVTLKVGSVLAYDQSFLSANVANTANLGKPLAFAVNAVASSASPQFLWAQIGGQCPVFSGSSVAADTAIGITAAGTAGAAAAGKTIMNTRVTKPATTTVVKTSTSTFAGSPVLRVMDTSGWFVGVSVSGTGITTSLITGINPDNREVTLASNSTATAAVTATGTYNDAVSFFNVVTCQRPLAQGPIT